MQNTQSLNARLITNQNSALISPQLNIKHQQHYEEHMSLFSIHYEEGVSTSMGYSLIGHQMVIMCHVVCVCVEGVRGFAEHLGCYLTGAFLDRWYIRIMSLVRHFLPRGTHYEGILKCQRLWQNDWDHIHNELLTIHSTLSHKLK